MVVSGQVWVGKRRTPVAGARILVYHTNAEGRYARDDSGYAGAYLCAALRTDEGGRYHIETIRPGPRPDGPASHIHFEVTVPWGERFFDSVGFEGDLRLGSMRAGESWSEFRPVALEEDGTQRVQKDIWLRY